jgi:hypothetical protein
MAEVNGCREFVVEMTSVVKAVGFFMAQRRITRETS